MAGPGPQLGRWVSTAARRWPSVSAGVGIVSAATVVLQCSPKPNRLTAAICIPTAYLGAERAAETDQLGACAVPGGFTPPWDWRHSMRRSPSTIATPADGRSRCKKIGSIAKAQEALHHGQPFLVRDVVGVWLANHAAEN